jgi:probable phosphoglycerate mutase
MSALHLNFMRHGATAPNLAGLRCGGDLDAPLTEVGRRQAVQGALHIRELRLPLGLIVSSGLQRSRDTAQIVSRVLQGVPTVVIPEFAERALGEWNLRTLAETEAAVVEGLTPPGGESRAEFFDRIAGAVQTLLPLLSQQPLLVGSKGVARVLRELTGQGGPKRRHPMGNCELAHFDLAPIVARDCAAWQA